MAAHVVVRWLMAVAACAWTGVAAGQGNALVAPGLEELQPLIDAWKDKAQLASGSKLQSVPREQFWIAASSDGHVFEKPVVALRSYALRTHLPVTGPSATAVGDLEELRSDAETECSRQAGAMQAVGSDAVASSVPMVAKTIDLLRQRRLLGRLTCTAAGKVLFQVRLMPNQGAESSLMPMGWNWGVRIDILFGQPLTELELEAQAYRANLATFRERLRTGMEVQVPAGQFPLAMRAGTLVATDADAADLCALVVDVKPGIATLQLRATTMSVPSVQIYPGGVKVPSTQARASQMRPRQSKCLTLD